MYRSAIILLCSISILVLGQCRKQETDILPVDYVYVERTIAGNEQKPGMLVSLPGRKGLIAIGDFDPTDQRKIIDFTALPGLAPKQNNGLFRIIPGDKPRFFPIAIAENYAGLSASLLNEQKIQYVLLRRAMASELALVCALPFQRAVIIREIIRDVKMKSPCNLQGITQDTFTDGQLYQLPKTIFFFSEPVTFSG